MSKPLYLDVIGDLTEVGAKMLSKATFDSLSGPEGAEAFAKTMARKHRVKIVVRGRKGDLRFMADGRR